MQTVIRDYDNAFIWAEKEIVETEIDEGSFRSVRTHYDDGLYEYKSFLNDMPVVFHKHDLGDNHDFQWIQVTYDENGLVAQRSVTFDNGVETVAEYENGIRVSLFRDDRGDVMDWGWRSITYTPDGELNTRTTTQDSGVVTFERFNDGIRTLHRQDDVANTQDWERIDTEILYSGFYNDDFANVAPFSRTTWFDNGIVKEEVLENGATTSVVWRDEEDIRDWRFKSTSYDTDGGLAGRHIVFDNGIGKIEEFHNGIRSALYKYDTKDALGWRFIRIVYDADGTITLHEKHNDDGSITTSHFDNGIRSETLREDKDDVFEWNTITSHYENGELAYKETTRDNGDTLLDIYENQQRTLRLEIDADGSDPWAVAVTEFGAGGHQTEVYGTAGDLPEPYLNYYQDFLA
ncbi:hypothetical protein [Leisingera sp. ANG-Vp]|uniref:hypothetical protein n=1 Tax=Leisingera sp. ANG-Vp TaxID=1577896 RepID=UPI00057EF8C4|nr:hypothetical protein [Leisingera sp. ANG-Vp]KIC14762.1 hypothetical protein RA20_19780 [Leisingera sp. ANG-Vp]